MDYIPTTGYKILTAVIYCQRVFHSNRVKITVAQLEGGLFHVYWDFE